MKLGLILPLVLLVSCKSENNSFKAGNTVGAVQPAKPEPSTKDAKPQETPGLLKTKAIDLQTFTPPMDMVWVIDNSGSMSEEIAKVKLNFSRFLASVQGRTDLRLTLVSARVQTAVKGDFGLDLPADAVAKGHKQIPISIGSTNALTALSSLICKADTSVAKTEQILYPNIKIIDTILYKQLFTNVNNPLFAQNKYPFFTGTICNLKANEKAYDGKTITYDYVDLREVGSFTNLGELGSNLRDGSRKVFVFVSDDDASIYPAIGSPSLPILINSKNFFETVGIDSEDSTVFGFAGMPSATSGSTGSATPASKACSIARPGLEYQALATKTGGTIYDICQDDWSSSFDAMSKNIVALAQKSFQLEKTGVISVKKVQIGETVLSASQYEVKGRYLYLKDDSLAMQTGTLKIEYILK